MLTTEQINDLHRLYWSEHWPIRKIERHLRMGWQTIRKYLDAPAQGPATAASAQANSIRLRPPSPNGWRRIPPSTGAVIEQRLRPLGYTGGHTHPARVPAHRFARKPKPNRAFVRMEPPPGERFEVDWGHFGVLNYSGDKRKLYAFALVEAHSRMLYLEFTHSQSFETFVRCHMHAFMALAAASRAKSSTTIWLPPWPNTMAAWSVSYRAFSPSLANTASIRGPAIRRRVGRKAKWSAPSAMRGKASGRCASSPICTMSIARSGSGSPKSPTSGSIAKPGERPHRPLSSPPLCGRCRSFLTTIATRSKRSCTKISACSSMAIATVCLTAMWAAAYRQSGFQLRHHL